jgi:RNA polymerase sigma-70 factor (ECF subfamily)
MAADPIPLRTEELLAHAGWLRALARSLVADPATADDLVQDTWVAALRHPPDRDRPLRPWLARVVQNLASNRRRGETRRSERETIERPAGEAISPDKIAAEVEAQRMLAEAVLALDEPLRTTVALRYFRGMNASEIAAAQNVPSGTVRWRLKRAIELLRVALDGRFGGRRETWCVALTALLPRESGTLVTATATTSSLTTGVWIMTTSTKIGIAAVLALCIGFATWKLSEGEPPRIVSTDSPQDVIAEPLPPAAIDGVAEPVVRESLAATPPAAPVASERKRALPQLTAQDCCIVGRVVDADGTPLPDVVIAAPITDVEEPGLLSRQWSSGDPAHTTSGEDGVFRIQVPAATPCAVIAEAQGYASRALSPCFAGQVVEIVLTRGTTVNVRVMSRRTSDRGAIDTPLEGAFIEAWATASGQPRGYFWTTATSNALGQAVLLGIPEGKIRVGANKKDLVRSGVDVISPGTGSVACEIALAEPSVLEGLVLDRKTRLPISDANVDVNREVGVASDSSGRYRLASFPPGVMTHSVGASSDGYAPSYTYVSFAESGMTKRVDFELEPAQRIRGRVVDSSGGPVFGAGVSYSARIITEPFLGETHRGSVVTREDGVFELIDLHPDTAYRLILAAEAHGALALTIGPFAAGTLPADLGDIELAAPGSIAGHVEGDGARDVRYVVRLHADGGPDDARSRLGSTRPDPKGRFVFDDLGPGRYRVELVRRRAADANEKERVLAAQTVDLRAGEAKTEVVLREPGAEVHGRVVDARGAPIGDCRVLLFDTASPSEPIASTTSDDDGSFRIAFDARAPVRLLVDDPRLFHDSKSIDGVQPGGDEIVVALEPFRSTFTIRGRILDISGKAPERVYVAFTDTTTKQRLGRVAMPDEAGRFEMKDLRDVAYDLELVDFGNLYTPAKAASVKPSGDDVVLQIERRE